MPKYSFSLLVFILYSNICFFEIQRKMMLHIFQNWMIKLCQNLIHYLKAVNYLKKVVFRLVLSFSSYTIQSGLKKLFGWLHSILGLRVGSVGRDIFFNFGEGQSCSCSCSIESWSREKELLSATIITIDSDKALVNQCNERIRFNQ